VSENGVFFLSAFSLFASLAHLETSKLASTLSSPGKKKKSYPDFASISPAGSLSSALDAVVVTHFHLDHCGALPVLVGGGGGGSGGGGGGAGGSGDSTKVRHRYDGPIYMTYPTKAMLPLMLEDFHKVVTSRGGGGGKEGGRGGGNATTDEVSFSRADIDTASRAAVAVPLHATVPIAGGKLTLRAFYAGHVLGAAMFEVRVADAGSEHRNRGLIFGDRSGSLLAVDGASVLYSGDYNMTPDRHLGPARPLRTRPDVFITESTYATTVRGPKKQREREFLDAVVAAVGRPRAGKVLVPVFALGRAQELMCLIEDHWSALGLWATVPVFYSAGMVLVFCFGR
jgi:integrator complex subunit 11